MKFPLLATRLGISAFKIMVVLIVVLSVLPLLMGEVSIDQDADQDMEWSFEDGVMTMQAPLGVENHGFFDINDVMVKFMLKDQSGHVLVRSETTGMDIPAGGRTFMDLGIELDLNDISRDDLTDMVFNGSDLRFEIGISARYSLDLVRASLTTTSDMGWEPMVRDMDIRTDAAMPMYDGAGHYMYIPYSFSLIDMMDGQPLLVSVSFQDALGNDGEYQTVVQAHQHYLGMALVPISLDTYDRLVGAPENVTASLTIGLLDVSKTVHENWRWTP